MRVSIVIGYKNMASEVNIPPTLDIYFWIYFLNFFKTSYDGHIMHNSTLPTVVFDIQKMVAITFFLGLLGFLVFSGKSV